MNLTGKRVLLTGASGFLGKYIEKELWNQGARIHAVNSKRFDLRELEDIKQILSRVEPEIVIHAAAKCGGIGMNQERPGELFYDNAIMGIQLMEQSRIFGVEKFVTIGTVCEYPKHTPVPFEEYDIWEGYPEETNAAYGLAKKMLLVQGQAYRKQYGMNVIHLLPVNLYGPGDNFNPDTSHVIPALIKKFFEAKQNNYPQVKVWGDGSATREFLYVEDAAEGIVRAAERYDSPEPINIGSGFQITIQYLSHIIATMFNYNGEIVFDKDKPNGQQSRKLDVSKAKKFGFEAKTNFKDGLKKTIEWYVGSI